MGAKRIEQIYNVVNLDHLRAKEDYRWGVRRERSCPATSSRSRTAPVIDALADVPGLELLLVGDGPYHDALRERARRSGVADRTTFMRSMPNDSCAAACPSTTC